MGKPILSTDNKDVTHLTTTAYIQSIPEEPQPEVILCSNFRTFMDREGKERSKFFRGVRSKVFGQDRYHANKQWSACAYFECFLAKCFPAVQTTAYQKRFYTFQVSAFAVCSGRKCGKTSEEDTTYATYSCSDVNTCLLSDDMRLTPSRAFGEHEVQILHEGMQQMLQSILEVRLKALLMRCLGRGKFSCFSRIASFLAILWKVKTCLGFDIA